MTPRGGGRVQVVSAVRSADSSAEAVSVEKSAAQKPWARLWDWFKDGPLVHSYYALAASAILLSAMGAMMVLSSSAVESISAERSAFYFFQRQVIFGVVGIVAMIILSLIPSRLYRAAAVPVFLLTVVGLGTVMIWGTEVNGNQNWIQIGSFTAQPSEAAKLGAALMLGWYFAKYTSTFTNYKNYVWPSVVILLVPLIGVGMGGDAGTAIIFAFIYFFVLFFVGAPWVVFVWGAVLGACAAVMTVMAAPHRLERFSGWTTGDCDAAGSCWQAQQGLAALATGGWFGVGLGQSRSKYSYVPEAHNDYIFAIIGEELGLIGTFFILALFAVMAVAMARVLFRSSSLFERITTGGILAWLIGQASINIAMVAGWAPVIGVPLPFISYGGSSLFMCLCAVGVVMSFTRFSDHRRVKATGSRRKP